MRIRGLGAENFLSFGQFSWEDLDPHVNIIVGPNGAGKTNLFRLVRAVADALDPGARARWQKAGRNGGDAFRVWLDLELTGEWEQELLRAFLRAALCDQQAFLEAAQLRGPTHDTPDGARPERWVTFADHMLERLDLARLLDAGRLTVSYEDGAWRIWYEPPSSRAREGRRVRWQLDVAGADGLSIGARSNGSLSFPAAVVAALSDQQRVLLRDYLTGVSDSFHAPDLQQLLAACASQTLLLRVRQVGNSWPVEAHREFERLAGVRLESGLPYGGMFLFQRLLRRALVFTENIRQLPGLSFSPSQVWSDLPIDLSDGRNLALFLFRLKNGDREERARYAAARELFRQLTGNECDLDVGLDAPTDDRAPTTDRGQSPKSEVALALHVARSGHGYEVPLELAGAGIAEALFLSAVIAGTKDAVMLLDEPALNLHPSAQASLSRAIDDHQHNQFLVVTHSPSLVRPESLEKVSRLGLDGGQTRRWALAGGPLDQERLNKLHKVLRGSLDARALLFSSAVILAEGETELGAFPVWYEKAFGQSFERSNVAILSVGGDQGFETYLHLARAFGIRWAIVCDGGVIGPPAIAQEEVPVWAQEADNVHDLLAPEAVKQLPPLKGTGRYVLRLLEVKEVRRVKKTIAQQMANAGVADGLDLERYNQGDFSDRRRALEEYGVFTVASTPDKGQGIESPDDLPVITANKAAAESEVGGSKVRIGRWIAERQPCPPEVADLLTKVRSWLKLSIEQTPTPSREEPGSRPAPGAAELVPTPDL